MTVEDKFSFFGDGGLFSDGFFLSQLGLAALTAILFAGAVVLCLLAMRAAASARQAHGAALDLHASVERHASQMQLLGADVERIAQDMTARQKEISAQFNAASQAVQQTPESDAPIQSGNEPVRRAFDKDAVEPEIEATVPKSLLRGLLRRR